MTRPRGWWLDLVMVVLFVALTVALASGHLLRLDLNVANWVDDHRPRVLYWIAWVLNHLGQGGQVLMPVSIVLAAVATWRRHSIRPLIVFAAAFVLTLVTIGPLKIWFHRAAPHANLANRAELFNHQIPPGEYAVGYPSGHTANALVWFGVIAFMIAILTGRTYAVIRIVPPAVLFCTTIYLAYHWITDSIAGLFLGVVLTRLMARVPWATIPLPQMRGWERPLDPDPAPHHPLDLQVRG